jgi:hypothetical protein
MPVVAAAQHIDVALDDWEVSEKIRFSRPGSDNQLASSTIARTVPLRLRSDDCVYLPDDFHAVMPRQSQGYLRIGLFYSQGVSRILGAAQPFTAGYPGASDE